MNIRIVAALVAFLWIADAKAQTSESNHSLNDSLYWVVETNLFNRSFAIVRIYNRQNIKVYEVRLQGEYIDIRNPKHRKKLDSILTQVREQAVAPQGKKTSKIL